MLNYISAIYSNKYMKLIHVFVCHWHKDQKTFMCSALYACLNEYLKIIVTVKCIENLLGKQNIVSRQHTERAFDVNP